ncbi:protein tramtrack, alpha isoform isoform X1 [Sitodiplosis mosellana]|uniref:protein tramtrack, alpha isoform isoform X1 n=1 Tax=Sitodiplosis mosellana TaxID=263140 RepID=UPI002443DE13|nr:protein tramtrack, alpha isoform isoform X1 [Sitodiplosis mosellana]XP_055326730.1 protein tramtrack, alpha isoform isoform X1 [Sitodiplosis mosellana]XP_055326731.1 protein tramtrack, alpha isoform isoform X1 [Sitodiplosis mosellana]XP_055326732.1 protein tramtrack, alpha isoform isoform X1 [Sitodiplosis mosellana]XP_055326733.1 protein tramtrack, alpha isoform isoform X1 [Sitodiplosis mosellana]XP_055326734.1 protein tramtrack, alpha isoform isoform X1 [Sitodiplosis mosellana]XP_05532673
MASQRFCLRWNNHQTNLLSVFDQLLHAETFTDVTLAVEGQYLKAHKMVLSACSPYFQALFINHPEKHPIVILKDITFADMKSLLDFMYRGEVSVDQDRLTAFLRVAESLRIKGLTEVNDDKPEKSETPAPQTQPSSQTVAAQPPQLNRIQQPYTQQQKVQGMMLTNPLLGSALTQPKRKRGRPRKLSGSSNGNDFDDYESSDNIIQGSPELLEVKMGTDGYSDGSDENNRDIDNENSVEEPMDTTEPMKSDTPQPSAKEPSPQKEQADNNIADERMEQMTLRQSSNAPKQYVLVASNNQSQSDGEQRPTMKIRINPLTQRPSTSNLANALQQLQSDSINNNQMTNDLANNLATTIQANFMSTQMAVAAAVEQQQQQLQKKTVETNPKTNDTSAQSESVQPSAAASRQPQRRRCRRKGSNQDDQAEHLTEMSVRGLNLFRYAKIFEGIYQCTECAKENVQKTFKNKYSFQRHAFLYHEGTSRKVFPCPVCSKEFSRPDKMKNHMKMTHDCYTPKETVAPTKATAQSQVSATNQQREQEQKLTNTNDTQSGKQTSTIRIENVMSQYNAQIADAAQHIKIEVSD